MIDEPSSSSSPIEGRGYTSRLLLAKQKRKDASHDAQVLKNRIALLKAEEHRAWKKIEQTRTHAAELTQRRHTNAVRNQEKRTWVKEQEQTLRATHDRFQAQKQAKGRLPTSNQRLRQNSVVHLKEAKQQWRRDIERARQIELREAIKKKEDIQHHQERVKLEREKERLVQKEKSRARAAARIDAEEISTKAQQSDIQKMEKLEMELIKRLRDTQVVQKEAYEELEHALGRSKELVE